MKTILIVAAALVVAATSVTATPQIALLSGSRCSNCHVAASGGGQRTHLGWYTMHDVGLISRESPLVSWLYSDYDDDQVLDGELLFGTDIRIQNTRSFASSEATRVTFPMQATVYGSFMPIDELSLDGQFNFAALRKAPNSDKTVRFPGQRMGMLSLNLKPEELPSVRVGFFRPNVGMRYDDHTTYPYSYVTNTARQNYYGPDWAEWGSQLTWEQEWWVSAYLGIFGSEGLSQIRLSDGQNVTSAITGDLPTITAKAVFWPGFFDETIETYAGGSILLNNDFNMTSVFLGAGWVDLVYVMIDYTQTTKKDVMQSRNLMTEVGLRVTDPILLYARYEIGSTKQQLVTETASLRHAVLGAQLFVMPFFEIRPEYRIFDSDLPGTTNRWNIQFHLFY